MMANRMGSLYPRHLRGTKSVTSVGNFLQAFKTQLQVRVLNFPYIWFYFNMVGKLRNLTTGQVYV